MVTKKVRQIQSYGLGEQFILAASRENAKIAFSTNRLC